MKETVVGSLLLIVTNWCEDEREGGRRSMWVLYFRHRFHALELATSKVDS